MSFYITPENYLDLPAEEQRATVPIYMPVVDSKGNNIPRGWFVQGVVPAANALRKLADFHLGDVWRASELAEHVVTKLVRRHGEDLGHHPWRRVIVWAQWEAQTLKAGDQWLRKSEKARVDLNQVCNVLTRQAFGQAVTDENSALCRIMLDTVDEQLSDKETYQKAYRMLRVGCTWNEIQSALGLKDRKDTLRFKKAFYRYATAVH